MVEVRVVSSFTLDLKGNVDGTFWRQFYLLPLAANIKNHDDIACIVALW